MAKTVRFEYFDTGGNPKYFVRASLNQDSLKDTVTNAACVPCGFYSVRCKDDNNTRILLLITSYLWSTYNSEAQDADRFVNICNVFDFKTAAQSFSVNIGNTYWDKDGAVRNIYPNATNIEYLGISKLPELLAEEYMNYEFVDQSSSSQWHYITMNGLGSSNDFLIDPAFYIMSYTNSLKENIGFFYNSLNITRSNNNSKNAAKLVGIVRFNDSGSTNNIKYYFKTGLSLSGDYINEQAFDGNAHTKCAQYILKTYFNDPSIRVTQRYLIGKEAMQSMFQLHTKFHSDPIYIEATKLKYTDGTYNFIQGVADSNRARKAAYKSLLNTYGSFYKGTEEQLSNSFTQSLDE